MDLKENDSELLFAYGTLQTEAVQLSTFGRRLSGTEDGLVRYQLRIININDQNFVDRKLVQLRPGVKARVYLQQP